MVDIKQGDTKILRVNVKDSLGNIQDLTLSQIAWKLSQKVNTAPLISKSTPASAGISITDPATAGNFDITINPTDTVPLSGSPLTPGEYYHECKVTDMNGNKATIFSGKVIISSSLVK